MGPGKNSSGFLIAINETPFRRIASHLPHNQFCRPDQRFGQLDGIRHDERKCDAVAVTDVMFDDIWADDLWIAGTMKNMRKIRE